MRRSRTQRIASGNVAPSATAGNGTITKQVARRIEREEQARLAVAVGPFQKRRQALSSNGSSSAMIATVSSRNDTPEDCVAEKARREDPAETRSDRQAAEKCAGDCACGGGGMADVEGQEPRPAHS